MENNNNYKENNYIVKANKLIEAKGKLGTVEQKLLAALILEIEPDDTDFKKYELNIKEVSEFINLRSNAIYEQLKTAARSLQNKEIIIENIDKRGKKDFLITRLLSSARYKEGEGFLEIHIDPNLKPYLVAIRGKETPFTQYMIKNILKLNSSYAIRLYEILKQWENVKIKKINVENLKEMLGADEESYKRFDNFERRVLKTAKDEINEHTDLFIVYEKIKEGRKITDNEFTVESKDKNRKVYIEFLKDFYDIKTMQEKMGLQDEKLNTEQITVLYNIAVEKTSHDNLDPFLYVSINYKYIKDKAKNKYAYLKKALEEDLGRATVQIRTGYQVY